jgi:glycerophosphoryl diester phosphodiesterase
MAFNCTFMKNTGIRPWYITFLSNVTAYHENISCHETNNKQHIGVNDISTVSLTFLTNVAPYHEKHILAYDEEQAAYRCQRHFNSIIDISYKCSSISWKHILSWDEQQAAYRCQRHFNSIIDISYKCNSISWKHILSWDEQQAAYRCQRHFNSIIDISYKCNCPSWKHIMAWDEQQAAYRCQRHFNSISLTFLTNVTAYHENISWHETNNKQHIGVNDISTISLKFTVIPK